MTTPQEIEADLSELISATADVFGGLACDAGVLSTQLEELVGAMTRGRKLLDGLGRSASGMEAHLRYLIENGTPVAELLDASKRSIEDHTRYCEMRLEQLRGEQRNDD